jgi:hypothetical protein
MQVFLRCEQLRQGASGMSANRPTQLMYGMLLGCFGFTMYKFGGLMAVPRNLLFGGTVSLNSTSGWLASPIQPIGKQMLTRARPVR